MSIDSLTSLIQPPVKPSQVGSCSDWTLVEEELGVEYPSDFKAFVNSYGSGSIGRFYWVWNPYSKDEYLDQVRMVCKYESELKSEFPEYHPYAIFPDAPGFLPWGSDENGNYYGWLTIGEPDKWPILTNEVRGSGYELHNRSFSKYLTGVFNSEIKPLAGDYPKAEDMVFEQI